MQPKVVNGSLRFHSSQRVDLITPNGTFLLVRDAPPLGNFGLEDISAAAQFFHQFGKEDGDPAEVLGFEQTLPSGNMALLVSRLLS